MVNKKLKEQKQRATKLIKELKKLFPKAKLALKHKTDWQLLVAVRLSAQCTDKKINEITPALFKRFKTAKDFSNADQKELEKYIYQSGFYRAKAKSLIQAAKYVDLELKGKLPKTIKEMIKIPGIARKSANVLLGNLFGIVEGIVVDTHMIRFSQRFGFSIHKNAVKIERDLMEIIDPKEWFLFSYLVVEYGRSYGNSMGKRELHEKDPLIKIYPKAKNCWPK